MTIATAVGISLEVGCDYQSCAELAAPLLSKMGSGKYDECAVFEIPDLLDDWRAEHRTARKRAGRCARRGYNAGILHREDWLDDIHAINVSKPRRQGRPMSPGYLDRPTHGPLPDYLCGRHAIRASGVWAPSGRLVGYLVMYRVGDLALVSQILGHGEFEDAEIMFLLFEYALGREIAHGPGVCVYNRWDSGEWGLQQFKGWLGFREAPVEWLP